MRISSLTQDIIHYGDLKRYGLQVISQYLLTFLTPEKEEYFYQGGVPPVTEKLCRTWSGLISSLKPFVRSRKEPSQKKVSISDFKFNFNPVVSTSFVSL